MIWHNNWTLQPARRLAVPFLILFLALFCTVATFAQTSQDVRFRTAPANVYIFELVSGHTEKQLELKAADNGGRMARLSMGSHHLVFRADGYVPVQSTITVSGSGLVIEQKLELLDSVLKLSAIVATDKRPKSVEFTPDGRYLVVAHLSGAGLKIFDVKTGALVASPAPPKEWAIKQGFVETAFPPGREEIWVSQMYTDRIHVFSLVNFSYLRTFRCGGTFPKVILAHPDGRVFVSNWLSHTVSVLSPDGSKVLASLKTSGIPRGMACSMDGTKLYVANFENGTIEVFDAYGTRRIDVLFDGSRGLPKGGAKRHLVVDPVRNRLYASDMARASVFAYDLDSGTLLAEVSMAPGAKTNTIAVSPDGRWIYVSTRGPNNPVDYEIKGPAFGELVVIDADSLEVTERHWGGNQPTGLAVSPDGRTLAFTDFLDHRLEVYRRTD